MKTKNEIAASIENIIKNTKRIHGKNNSIDWIKVASQKAASYLFDLLKKNNET